MFTQPMTLRSQLLFAAFVYGCGAAPPPPVEAAPAARQRPCEVGELTLEVPVAEGFALAGDGTSCLLIDERAEATFMTLGALELDREGAEQALTEPRAFFMDSGLLGAEPRFTGVQDAGWLGQDVRVDLFVSQPEGLPPRAGFAMAARVGNRVVIAIGFHAPQERGVQEWTEAMRVAE